jgi:hypothetical protein
MLVPVVDATTGTGTATRRTPTQRTEEHDMTDTTYAVDEPVTTEHGIYRVQLEIDEIAGDFDDGPRSYDGKVAVIVADSREYLRPQEGDLPSTILHALDEYSARAVARWLRMFHGATVVLALRNGGYGDGLYASDIDNYDRPGNLAGLAYDQPETRAELGEDATTEQVKQAISVEVDEYSKWATGEVYGYIVERVDEDGNVLDRLDSCWGHIGAEWAAEAAVEALAYVIEDEGEKYAAAQAEKASDEAEIADLAACELGMPTVTA